MAIEDYPPTGSECPDLDDLLDDVQRGTLGATSVSTHLEQCERCNATLNSVLIEQGIVASMRHGNPLGAFADEPELESLLGKFDHAFAAEVTKAYATDESELEAIAHPERIGGYEITERIAQGGMGVVYRAHHASLKRDVALKMVLPHGDMPRVLQRFKTESQAIARLQHPHVIQIFDVGEHEGLPFFSMELLEGGDLEQRLERETMTPREAAELTAVLADAVHYSHTKDILHRDLKPSNVLFTAGGVPKVGDFGLAKCLDDGDRQLTQDDTVLGTPGYMAPEQARGANKQIGPATDVYGLGALLYRILTGRAPFTGENKLEILEQVRRQAPVAPSRYNSHLCPDLEAICLKCLAKSPRQRYESAQQLADDLRRWLAGEMPQARSERRQRRFVIMAAVAASFALVIGAGWAASAIYAGRYSPEAQRQRLAMRLRQDAPTVLVGAKGLPSWHGIAGEPGVAEPLRLGHDRTVTARSRGVTFVVLADDPQHDSYRLRAEVRHDLAGRADCGAGLFVCAREYPFGGEHMQLGCLLRFNDLRDAQVTMAQVQALRPNLIVPQVYGNRLRFVPHMVFARIGMAEPEEAMLPGTDSTFKPAYDGKRWRTLEIEVHRDRLLARWENGPPLKLLVSEAQQEIAARLPSWYKKYKVGSINPPPTIDVRGKLGIYVRNGSVSFRNVRLEPLKRPSSTTPSHK